MLVFFTNILAPGDAPIVSIKYEQNSPDLDVSANISRAGLRT